MNAADAVPLVLARLLESPLPQVAALARAALNAPAQRLGRRGAGGPIHGGAKRPHGGAQSRFLGTSRHADRVAASLRAGHPALARMGTLFPSTVHDARAVPRLLVSGHNSAKIGKRIAKGPWRGLSVYTLTLEERATCPATCTLLAECFGNAMPFARRVRPGAALVAGLEAELQALASAHPAGFAVRLHVLGDFYDADYVGEWAAWMRDMPGLHVFGFTAHSPGSIVGSALATLQARHPDRWSIRWSVALDAPPGPGQATTIWRQPAAAHVQEGLVCPAQTGATAACATCGLCWHPAAQRHRIVFIGHGKRGRGAATSPRPPQTEDTHAPR